MEYIGQLLEKQRKLESLNQAARDTSVSLDKAQKALETYKVRISEESAQIVRKQREQLENRLEKEVQSAVRKVEQAEKKRAQEKEKQQKSHIADATQEYKDRIRQARSQMKADMKADKVPAFCNNSLWFSLFMPVFLTDYIIMIMSWVIAGLGVPILIYWLIPNHSIWQFYIIFPICLILVIMLHIEICRRTTGAHKETLKLCREKMNLIHELKSRIRKTEKTIIKNDDESLYELKDLDEKIQSARQALEKTRQNQSDSLNEFEQRTRLDIIEEFREKSQEKLEELTAAINHLSKEKNLSMEMASELQLEMIDDYEDILGAENLNPSRLEQILACLEEGSADTLEQALAILGFAGDNSADLEPTRDNDANPELTRDNDANLEPTRDNSTNSEFTGDGVADLEAVGDGCTDQKFAKDDKTDL